MAGAVAGGLEARHGVDHRIAHGAQVLNGGAREGAGVVGRAIHGADERLVGVVGDNRACSCNYNL